MIISDIDRGTDRVGRRAQRFLSPLQKYEIWLQLVRQEVTIAEAASAGDARAVRRNVPLAILYRDRDQAIGIQDIGGLPLRAVPEESDDRKRARSG